MTFSPLLTSSGSSTHELVIEEVTGDDIHDALDLESNSRFVVYASRRGPLDIEGAWTGVSYDSMEDVTTLTDSGANFPLWITGRDINPDLSGITSYPVLARISSTQIAIEGDLTGSVSTSDDYAAPLHSQLPLAGTWTAGAVYDDGPDNTAGTPDDYSTMTCSTADFQGYMDGWFVLPDMHFPHPMEIFDAGWQWSGGSITSLSSCRRSRQPVSRSSPPALRSTASSPQGRENCSLRTPSLTEPEWPPVTRTWL